MEGLQKVQLAVAGSEAEGFYRVLMGAVLQLSMSSAPSPPKRHCHAPTATISKLPPQESKGVEPEASAPVVEGTGLALEAPSSAVSQALEVTIPAHMTPLHLNVGEPKGCINVELRGAVSGCQPHGLLYVHRDHLG